MHKSQKEANHYLSGSRGRMTMDFTETVFYIFQLVGIIAFAISGAMVAVDKNVDLFGVVVLGLITAFGGGIMRDLMLGLTPPAFFTSFIFAATAIAASLAVFVFAYSFKEKYIHNEMLIEKINNIFDALGLGIFSVIGVKVPYEAGFGDNAMLIIIIALITATGGGILRDLMIMEIPFVLKKRIYAVAAILGASAYYALTFTPLNDVASQLIGVIITFSTRILATIFKWNFPKALGNNRKTHSQ